MLSILPLYRTSDPFFIPSAQEPKSSPARVYGRASQNAELIDFDCPESDLEDCFGEWSDRVKEKAPDVYARLAIWRTPSYGHHVGYRCHDVEIPGNHVLASRYVLDPTDPKKDTVEVLIETRGEGGYGLCPPAAGYTLEQGDPADLPVITAAERDLLHGIARELTEGSPRPKPHRNEHAAPQPVAVPPSHGGQPSDIYNVAATTESVVALFERHGWREVGDDGDGVRVLRPGATDSESSGTVGIKTPGWFHCFSTNAHPFEAERNYSPFACYALLEHGGDWAAAARAFCAEQHATLRTHHSNGTGRLALQGQNGSRAQIDPADVDEDETGAASAPVGESGEDSGHKIRLLSMADLRALVRPSYIPGTQIPAAGFGTLVGESGNGKTFVAVDIACRTVQRGGGHVVYICAEGSTGLRDRLEAWCSRYNAGRDLTNLWIVPRPVYFTIAEVAQDLYRAMEEVGCSHPVLTIIDTLARCFEGDENSTADMTTFIRAVDDLRETTGGAVLIAHHTGWGSERQRGSSALRAAVDVEMKVTRDELGTITVVCTKMKDDEPFKPEHYRLDPVAELAYAMEDDRCRTPAVIVPTSPDAAIPAALPRDPQAVFEFLNEVGAVGAGFMEISRGTGISRKPTLTAALDALTSAAYIVATGTKGRPDRRYYSTPHHGNGQYNPFPERNGTSGSEPVPNHSDRKRFGGSSGSIRTANREPVSGTGSGDGDGGDRGLERNENVEF